MHPIISCDVAYLFVPRIYIKCCPWYDVGGSQPLTLMHWDIAELLVWVVGVYWLVTRHLNFWSLSRWWRILIMVSQTATSGRDLLLLFTSVDLSPTSNWYTLCLLHYLCVLEITTGCLCSPCLCGVWLCSPYYVGSGC